MIAEAPKLAVVPAGSAHLSNNMIPNGQDNFFIGPEHERYNSHQKRQMHLKGQWKMEDMDPEGSIKRDLHSR